MQRYRAELFRCYRLPRHSDARSHKARSHSGKGPLDNRRATDKSLISSQPLAHRKAFIAFLTCIAGCPGGSERVAGLYETGNDLFSQHRLLRNVCLIWLLQYNDPSETDSL
jgi:hypothetical protein